MLLRPLVSLGKGIHMNDDFFKYRDRFVLLAKQIEVDETDNDYVIATYGKLHAGKNELIGALLAGQMNIASFTGEVCSYVYGSENDNKILQHHIKYGTQDDEVTIFYKNGGTEVISREKFIKKIRGFWESNVPLPESVYNFFNRIAHTEMHCTSAFLRNDITIVDTIDLIDSIPNKPMSSANVIIFILDACSLFSMHERDFISTYFYEKHMDNVFFAVNRIGQLSDAPMLESYIKPCVKQHLQKVFEDKNGRFDEELYGKRVFFVDAYGALCAKTGEKIKVFAGRRWFEFDADINETGFLEFEAALEQYHLESELQRMAKIYNDNTNNLGHKHRNEFVQTQNIEVYSQMRLLLELAYEAVYGEQPTEADLRQLVI